MNVVTLACPLCAGSIQVDPASAGQQVHCPLCQGLLQLPPVELLLPPGAEPPYLPPNASFASSGVPRPPPEIPQGQAVGPPPGGLLYALQCPLCTSQLQVPPDAFGHTVTCPVCQGLVQLPPLESSLSSPAPEVAPEPQNLSVPQGVAVPQGLPVPHGLPMGGVPQGFPPREQTPPPGKFSPLPPLPGSVVPSQPPARSAPPAEPKPRKERPRSEPQPSRDVGDLLPPGAAAPMKEPRDSRRKEAVPRPRDVSDLLPPGAPSPRPEPISSPPANAASPLFAPSSANTSTASDLLPPGMPPPDVLAPAPSAADALLPPGAASVSGPAVGATSLGETGRVIDSLLPPGVDAAPGQMRPLPIPKPPEKDQPAAGALTLADKPKSKRKRLGPDGEEPARKELTREEKHSRRFRRNLIMWTVCVLILAGVMWLLMR